MVKQRWAELDLHLLRVQVLHHCLMHLLERRYRASGSAWAHDSICTTSEALVG